MTGHSSALAVATHSEHHPPRRRLSVSSCPSPSPARKRPSHHARTSIHGLAVPLLRCQGSFIHYSPPAGSRRRRWSEGARPVGGCMHLQVVVVVAPSGGALMRARTAASPSTRSKSSRPAGLRRANEPPRARYTCPYHAMAPHLSRPARRRTSQARSPQSAAGMGHGGRAGDAGRTRPHLRLSCASHVPSCGRYRGPAAPRAAPGDRDRLAGRLRAGTWPA